eukprot:TRINITY_DN3125_c0_g1_i1.p1 TRINITY_DN3125_c0_g1~~TRINITY_DN3125_c0_g1_i1.p1  ORF type:complete len:65 (-),score=26.00 TRINITY_DN3125_c0_g1_i1:163-357(-)
MGLNDAQKLDDKETEGNVDAEANVQADAGGVAGVAGVQDSVDGTQVEGKPAEQQDVAGQEAAEA